MHLKIDIEELEGRLAGQAEQYEARCSDLQSQLNQSQSECKRLADHEDKLAKEMELLKDQIKCLEQNVNTKEQLYEQKLSVSRAEHEVRLK